VKYKVEIILDVKDLHSIVVDGTWLQMDVRLQEGESCGRNMTMLLGCQLIDVDETHLEMLINCPTSQHIWSKLMVVHE
jgi:hypothetical protein